MIPRTNIDDAVGYRWGGLDRIACRIGPKRLAATATARIKGIELGIIGTNIDDAVGYRWGGLDRIASSVGPI